KGGAGGLSSREPRGRYVKCGDLGRPRIPAHGLSLRGGRGGFRDHRGARPDRTAVRPRPGREQVCSRRPVFRRHHRRGDALFAIRCPFGPALAGLALRWIDVRTDIAVTTALLVFTIPGALATSQTRQHIGQGLSLLAPLRALARQAAFTPVVIGLISMTLAWGTFGAFAPIFAREGLGLPAAQV